jgi:hypothetical protein
MLKHSMSARVSLSIIAFASALLPLGTGCSGGKFPIVPAKGKVVCNGQPVTRGSVTFSPIGEAATAELGKPATAALGSDGMFVLSTHDRFDGAVVGKHSVQFVLPEGEEEESSEEDAPPEGSPEERARYIAKMKEQRTKKTACVQQGEIIVEVKKDGENDFTIELSPAK